MWEKIKTFLSDVLEYLQGLKTILYMMVVAAIGAAQQVGVEKFIPEQHVGIALVVVAFGGALLRVVTKGPMKGTQ